MNPCPICDYRETCPAADKEDWECPAGWNPLGDDDPIQDPDPDNELPWYSAGDLAVQNPQKAKEPSPFNTYLVKYEYKTHSAVSTDVHAEEFVAIAADKIDAVNKLMKHLEMLNRHFHRLRSVERYDHSHKDNNR